MQLKELIKIKQTMLKGSAVPTTTNPTSATTTVSMIESTWHEFWATFEQIRTLELAWKAPHKRFDTLINPKNAYCIKCSGILVTRFTGACQSIACPKCRLYVPVSTIPISVFPTLLGYHHIQNNFDKKLKEEISELLADKTVDEALDVFRVVFALAAHCGVDSGFSRARLMYKPLLRLLVWAQVFPLGFEYPCVASYRTMTPHLDSLGITDASLRKCMSLIDSHWLSWFNVIRSKRLCSSRHSQGE